MSIFKRAARQEESAAAEIARLRAALADRDRQLAEMGRRVDDLLDRESMHVYDPDMERLTTAKAIERQGAARVRRTACGSVKRPQLTAVQGNVTELEVTAPRIEHGVWEGFSR
ncbi:hypothetical protein [Nocardia nova]|uniref:hypothetical protein n=1 Tax=Nocardia nova TaxID=37330 RepID=UPI00189300B5|nr:hypothetical protein [Nocardia nova]MBF6150282.1 hypothetical protein [Nocardia nova]